MKEGLCVCHRAAGQAGPHSSALRKRRGEGRAGPPSGGGRLSGTPRLSPGSFSFMLGDKRCLLFRGGG